MEEWGRWLAGHYGQTIVILLGIMAAFLGIREAFAIRRLRVNIKRLAELSKEIGDGGGTLASLNHSLIADKSIKLMEVLSSKELRLPGQSPFRGKRCKNIMLVEDDLISRELTTEILEAFGFSVTAAADGWSAVDIFDKSPYFFFDCLLVDIQMPQLDGYQTTERIRELKRPDSLQVKIIGCSADVAYEERYRIEEAGISEILLKPIDTRELLKIFDSVTV